MNQQKYLTPFKRRNGSIETSFNVQAKIKTLTMASIEIVISG